MPSLRVDLAAGRSVTFSVAEPGPISDTCFVLGVRKCGSSIMNSLVIALAKLNKRHFLDVAGTFFKEDVAEREWRTDPAALPLFIPGQVHGGFRGMAPIMQQSPVWAPARKILLVRDPRDALVSEYFSVAYTHSVPVAQAETGGVRTEFLAAREMALQTSLEDYVLAKAASLDSTITGYADVARDPHTKLFRYEDVILRKRDWVRAMAKHFGWTAGSEDYLDKVMGWADVLPQTERPDQFIRRVTPGDHKEKLRPAVVEHLNARLAKSMALFGYR